MPLGIYSRVAFINNGSSLQVGGGASIEVRKEFDNSLATIYSDREGLAQDELDNPFNADGDGRFSFYAAGIDQGYKITVTHGSNTDTLRNQPIGTIQEKDGADVLGHHPGISEPLVKYPLMFWTDTGSGLIKQRNEANTAWVNKGRFEASMGGLLSTDPGDIGTDADTNEKTLKSYSLPAGILANDGDLVLVKVWGFTANTTAAKRIRFKVGGTTIYDSGDIAAQDGKFVYNFAIVRQGSNAQWNFSDGLIFFDGGNFGGKEDSSEDVTNAIDIVLTGQNSAGIANEIVAEGMIVQFFSKP